ncbi:MAG: Fe2+-dependent dioxygenase [Candidatus Promineifilaceae bacterium]|nr:Fe2+-dependent dioxygenase [Candidatus Promineifilaceae bacterium]
MLIRISQFLDPKAVRQLQDVAMSGRFADGRATAGDRVASVKRNEQLEPNKEQAAVLSSVLSQAVQNNETFRFFAYPRRMTAPRISRYEVGMEYGSHLDNPIMVRANDNPLRTDLSMTLFLSDPESYQGGELCLETPFGPQNMKLPAGDAVVYSTTFRHRVVEVTAGTRLVVVGWIESMVSDERKRQILFDLWRVRQTLKETPDQALTHLETSFVNLSKMWCMT